MGKAIGQLLALLTDELSGKRGWVALQIGQSEPLVLLNVWLLRLALNLAVHLRTTRKRRSSYLLIRKSVWSATKECISWIKMIVEWRCRNGISGRIGLHPVTKIKLDCPWLCAMQIRRLPGRSSGIHCGQWQYKVRRDFCSRKGLAENIDLCPCDVQLSTTETSWTTHQAWDRREIIATKDEASTACPGGQS